MEGTHPHAVQDQRDARRPGPRAAPIKGDGPPGTASPGEADRFLLAAGLAEAEHVIVTATLSKALGSQGGAVLGSGRLTEHLVNQARPFIFDTALAPAAPGAARAAAEVVLREPPRARRIPEATAALAAAGKVPAPAGAVLSVPVAGPHAAVRAVALCAAHDVRVGAFRPPSVRDGVSRVRMTVSAGTGRRPRPYAPGPCLRGRGEGAGRGVVSLPRVLLVTGTDTGVGKPVVTAGVAACLARHGSVAARGEGSPRRRWRSMPPPCTASPAPMTRFWSRAPAGPPRRRARRPGSLDHTGLTLEALAHRGLPVVGVVAVSMASSPGLVERTNLVGLADAAGGRLLGTVPEGAGALSGATFRAAATGWFGSPVGVLGSHGERTADAGG